MQSFLEAQGRFPRIRHHKLERELSAERCVMDQQKVGRPPFPGALVAFGEHADGYGLAGLLDRLNLPSLCADEAVSWRLGIVRLVSKPGETDGYSSTNCATV